MHIGGHAKYFIKAYNNKDILAGLDFRLRKNKV